jgi:hypothetical protein
VRGRLKAYAAVVSAQRVPLTLRRIARLSLIFFLSTLRSTHLTFFFPEYHLGNQRERSPSRCVLGFLVGSASRPGMVYSTTLVSAVATAVKMRSL